MTPPYNLIPLYFPQQNHPLAVPAAATLQNNALRMHAMRVSIYNACSNRYSYTHLAGHTNTIRVGELSTPIQWSTPQRSAATHAPKQTTVAESTYAK